MTQAQYKSNSPYYGTQMYGQFLDIRLDRPITKSNGDSLFTITPVYNLRPDLLASDLYNDSALWWVFAQRNPDVLKDPLFDFVTGTSIFVPTLSQVTSDLGL
jgi:hypothetical protein